MGLSRQEIADYWEERHGTLTPTWKKKLLTDSRLGSLTIAGDDLVYEAIRRFKKLDDIVAHVDKHKPKSPKPTSADNEPRQRTRSSRSRYSGGHYPHQPSDAALHKRIGSTQRYNDDT